MSFQKSELLIAAQSFSYNFQFQDVYRLTNCTITDALLPPVPSEMKVLLQSKVIGKIGTERKFIFLYNFNVWMRYYKPIIKP